MTAAVLDGQYDMLDAITEVQAGWWDSFDRACRSLAASGEPFQAHDLRAAGVPEPHHPNVWGAAIRREVRAGVIVRVGLVPSQRPSTRHSKTCLWIGAAA